MMGAMSYGMGMAAYVIHDSCGGGGAVTCTVLILILLCHARSTRPLGDMLHVQLDNTAAENKNEEVMATVAWLVFHRKFRRARVFFMQKGDTKTVLDQSFGTLMTGVHIFLTLPPVSLALHPSLSPVHPSTSPANAPPTWPSAMLSVSRILCPR